MGKAARDIIIQNGQLLVMRRVKNGDEYYTLVGGRVEDGEVMTAAVVRKTQETGLHTARKEP